MDHCRKWLSRSVAHNTIWRVRPLPLQLQRQIFLGLQESLDLRAVGDYPNPFDDNIRFSIQSDISGAAILEVYNILGVKIQTIYKGFVFAGKGQTIEYQVPNIYRTNLIYKLRVGDKTVTGKLINVK